MRKDRNENYFALLYILHQVTIPYFALQFRRNSPVFWCFEIPCQAQGSVSRMRADPDVLRIVKTAVIHRKYPFSDVNTVDCNIDYRSKCSSMIYGKTNVQSIAMKVDRSSAMVSLNTLQTTISLNIYKNSANKFGRKTGFKVKNEIEDQYQSIPKLTGIWTELRCIIGQNLEILTSTGGEWSCGQVQNCVNFDFQVKFDLEGQGHSTPKTIGILTKLLCMSGSSLVILAGTSDKLSRGQAHDWRPHGQMQATTIPEGQNWPRVKTFRGYSILRTEPLILCHMLLAHVIYGPVSEIYRCYF